MSDKDVRKVSYIWGLPVETQDCGVEIELETMGDNPFPSVRNSVWRKETDGSLRGNYSVEYVSRPMSVDEVGKQVGKITSALEKSGTTIDYTYRAGVHVHMNCQELTMDEVLKIACLYYILEEPLTRWCGPDRVGNYNCLRAIDAEGVIEKVKYAYTYEDWSALGVRDIRYAALNYNSLQKYGTLEFRAKSSNEDLSDIETWVKMLFRLKEKALQFETPREILDVFSVKGWEEFSKDVLGEYYDIISPRATEFDESMWLAQDLANYKVFVKVKPKDPLRQWRVDRGIMEEVIRREADRRANPPMDVEGLVRVQFQWPPHNAAVEEIDLGDGGF